MARQTSDYTKAASAVVQNMDSIYEAARSSSFKPDEVAKTIQNANTERYKAFLRSSGELLRTKNKNDSQLEARKRDIKAAKEIHSIGKPARMAGKIAGLGKLGVATAQMKEDIAFEKNLRDQEDARWEELQGKIEAYQSRPVEKFKHNDAELSVLKEAGIGVNDDGSYYVLPKPDTNTNTNTITEQSTPSTAEPSTPSAVEPPTSQTKLQPLSGNGKYSMDLSKLSSQDWRDLSYVVSGEAKRGTDDEYGVAASVLNRVKSSDFPNSISAVMHQPKQYEAIAIGKANYDSELAAKLSSPEGIKKLQSALETLQGRTDFKGQALLKNRVAAEDPMFHSGGNFYHYSHQ